MNGVTNSKREGRAPARQLEAKLREVDERLRRELRARGFDPDQDENLALTGPLAKLYTERESLREELRTMTDIQE